MGVARASWFMDNEQSSELSGAPSGAVLRLREDLVEGASIDYGDDQDAVLDSASQNWREVIGSLPAGELTQLSDWLEARFTAEAHGPILSRLWPLIERRRSLLRDPQVAQRDLEEARRLGAGALLDWLDRFRGFVPVSLWQSVVGEWFEIERVSPAWKHPNEDLQSLVRQLSEDYWTPDEEEFASGSVPPPWPDAKPEPDWRDEKRISRFMDRINGITAEDRRTR